MATEPTDFALPELLVHAATWKGARGMIGMLTSRAIRGFLVRLQHYRDGLAKSLVRHGYLPRLRLDHSALTDFVWTGTGPDIEQDDQVTRVARLFYSLHTVFIGLEPGYVGPIQVSHLASRPMSAARKE